MNRPSVAPLALVAVALTGFVLLAAAPSLTWAGEGSTAPAEPPDLRDNKKILEATVASFGKSGSGEASKAGGSSGRHLTLPELWELAESRFPGLLAGRESVRSARYTRDEQKWLRLPSGEITGFLSWIPGIRCMNSVDLGLGPIKTGSPEPCLATSSNLNFQTDDLGKYDFGPLVRIDARVLLPLFTFGKLDAAQKLGEVGIKLAQAQADGSRADTQMNLVRAYFGVKAARAALVTVKEGQDQIAKWVTQMDKDLESGKTNFTEIDLMRLKVTESVVQVQAIDAERIIASALAALRYVAQDSTVDVDDEDLQLWAREEHDLDYYLDAALRNRPELRTLKATGEGAYLYKKLRIAELLPDFGLLGTFSYGYAYNVQDQNANAFMNHLNYLGAGAGLAMRWGLDFGPKAARLQKAIADIHVFEARKRELLGGGALEVERQYNDLREAQQRLAASEKAERRARGWLQGIKQNIDVGTAESRDMIDALRTYFEQHVNALRAINDVNVAAALLRRLCGLEVISR